MGEADKSDFDYSNSKGDVLGRGGYAKVCVGRNKRTGKPCAAKVISTSRMRMSAIERERSLLARLDHPNIIRLYGFEDRGKEAILYMELADRGTLFTRVTANGCLTEAEARPYMSQILAGVHYLEGEGVVHRDLKLENILIDSADVCKISDFGLAHEFERHGRSHLEDGTIDGDYGKLKLTTLHEVCGSKSYAAPEVLEGTGYDGFAVDVWSCGICAFAMHAGFFPLDEATLSDWRFEKVRQADAARASATHTIYGFYDRECTLSAEVVALIDGMLSIDPSRRLTASGALDCAWFTAADGLAKGGGKAGGGGEPTYRSLGKGKGEKVDAAAIAAMYRQQDEELADAPVYRGVGVTSSGSAAKLPPRLAIQDAIFCSAFHLKAPAAAGPDAAPAVDLA